MLTAIVTACMFFGPPECATFEDTRGPYRTEDECIERIEEMISGIWEISPGFTVVSTSCAPKNDVQT